MTTLTESPVFQLAGLRMRTRRFCTGPTLVMVSPCTSCVHVSEPAKIWRPLTSSTCAWKAPTVIPSPAPAGAIPSSDGGVGHGGAGVGEAVEVGLDLGELVADGGHVLGLAVAVPHRDEADLDGDERDDEQAEDEDRAEHGADALVARAPPPSPRHRVDTLA